MYEILVGLTPILFGFITGAVALTSFDFFYFRRDTRAATRRAEQLQKENLELKKKLARFTDASYRDDPADRINCDPIDR